MFTPSVRSGLLILSLPLILLLVACQQPGPASRTPQTTPSEKQSVDKKKTKQFEASWDSLSEYTTPAWFRDAKFGIFLHWGVESVPGSYGADDGWYARHMYMKPEDFESTDKSYQGTYEFHLEHFGHPSEFGFKDFIPKWKAKTFDPVALTRFFKSIGARYVVPMAVHHDNFANYDSTHQPWNAVNMGPKKDLISLWKHASDKVGIRLGLSSHAARTPGWYNPAYGEDEKGAYDANLTQADGNGTWWEGYDPRDLYGPPPKTPALPYARRWLKRTKELVNRYDPDLLYLDGTLPFGGYGMRLGAHFYNRNTGPDGTLNGVLTLKWMKKRAAVKQVEKGTTGEIQERPWQAGTTLQKGWFWQKGVPLSLDGGLVIDKLVDVVSKNGNLLLNVGPRPDGTLPENQRRQLKVIGQWMDVNADAIHGTRPWHVYGEGPTNLATGNFKERTLDDPSFHPEDIRYTTEDGVLYAIALAWPEDGTVQLDHLGREDDHGFGAVADVSMMGSDKPLDWSRTADHMTVRFPETKPCRHAYVLVIVPAGE